jgi:hypothetical protein
MTRLFTAFSFLALSNNGMFLILGAINRLLQRPIAGMLVGYAATKIYQVVRVNYPGRRVASRRNVTR